MENPTIMEIIKIIIAIILAVVGLIIGHHFTSKRDKLNKKRELILNELMIAYRILANEISTRNLTKETKEKLEHVLTDIQLFGTLPQIELAIKLSDEIANKPTFDLDPLINNLRDSLRVELDLPKINKNVNWLRIKQY